MTQGELWSLTAEKFVEEITSPNFSPEAREAFYDSLPFGPDNPLPDVDFQKPYIRLLSFLVEATRVREIARDNRLEYVEKLLEHLEEALQTLEISMDISPPDFEETDSLHL
jgi:hypothetical protein